MLLAALAALAAFLVAGACGGGEESPPPSIPQPRPPQPQPPAETQVEPAPAPLDPAADEQELLSLARAFFTALIEGDGAALWGLLAGEIQAEFTREQVGKAAQSVAAASREPAFVLNGVRALAIEGDRAVFILDAYITDNVVRAGSEAEVEDAPPLHAVREGGRWRLIPDRLFLTLRDLSLGVEADSPPGGPKEAALAVFARWRRRAASSGAAPCVRRACREVESPAHGPQAVRDRPASPPTASQRAGPPPGHHRLAKRPWGIGLTGNWVRFVTPLSLPAPRIEWACMQRGSVGTPIPRAH